MLQSTAVGFGHFAMAAMLQNGQVSASEEATDRTEGSMENFARHHFPPRAKRVIFLFMKGGPSHMDTFDFKPQLQKDDGKDLPFDKPRVQFAATGKLLASPWKFSHHGECGMQVSELFPHVAKCVDDICFLHSVHGTNPAHGGAAL